MPLPPVPAALVDTTEAAIACRILILAYARDPEHVDWSDVQGALTHALRAFNLPLDYPERVAAARDGDAGAAP